LIERLKSQKGGVTLCIVAVAFLAISSAVSGCSLDDIIKADVPKGIQQALNTEERVPMSQAEMTWDEWLQWVDNQSRRFADEIDRGTEAVALIQSITDTGIGVLGEASSTLPGGALISTGLALAGGLMLRRPGEEKRVSKEKESSFTAGLEEGKKLLSGTVAELMLKNKKSE